MTKFILHGGNTSDDNSDNDYFFRELVNGSTGNITVLLCYFACKKADVERKSKQDIKRITNLNPNKNLDFLIAESQQLKAQLKKADVFYMRGGNELQLIAELKKTPSFENYFKNKTIAGSSAGVYALVQYYYSNERKRIEAGLGLLNIQSTCHFTPKNQDAVKSLGENSNLPSIVLPNYKSVVLYN